MYEYKIRPTMQLNSWPVEKFFHMALRMVLRMEKLTEEEFYRKVRELAKLYRAAGFSKRDSFSRARSKIKDQFARAGRALGRMKRNDT